MAGIVLVLENKHIYMDLMEKVVNLAKQRGFVFPGSEIYGGLANSWDYGPLGTALKNNLRDAWWKYFVTQRTDMVGMDSAVIMNPKVWEASGHTASFNDAFIDCKKCKKRHRADHLVEDNVEGANVEGVSNEDMGKLIAQHEIPCPDCGAKDFTEVRTFNLMFQTSRDKFDAQADPLYLRGEIAQGMFTNFANVVQTMRPRLPFGIAQVGKAFRNEITPGNFIFRTLEFDLMEFEYFIRPENWEKTFEMFLAEMKTFAELVGVDMKRTRVREHTQDELSFYSQRTVDIEFETPFGWKEMFGLAYRTDYDLSNHAEQSGKDLQYTDPISKEKFFPHVIEPTFGLTRLVLMTLLSAYDEEELKDGESRTVLRFKPSIAPVKIAILPLSKKEPLQKQAGEINEALGAHWDTMYDETQSIGKRYRRQDEIGTPYCVTIDFDTLEDNAVTVRERDSMEQERIKIEDLKSYFNERL